MLSGRLRAIAASTVNVSQLAHSTIQRCANSTHIAAPTSNPLTPKAPAVADHKPSKFSDPSPAFQSSTMPPSNAGETTPSYHDIDRILLTLRRTKGKVGVVIEGKALTRDEAINYLMKTTTTINQFHTLYFLLQHGDPRRIDILNKAIATSPESTSLGLTWYLMSYCLASPRGTGRQDMPAAVNIAGKNYSKLDVLVESIRYDPGRHKSWAQLGRVIEAINGRITLHDGVSYDAAALKSKARAIERQAVGSAGYTTLSDLVGQMENSETPANHYHRVAFAMTTKDIIKLSDGRQLTKLEMTAMACSVSPTSDSCWAALVTHLLTTGHTEPFTLGDTVVSVAQLAATLTRTNPSLWSGWCLLGHQWIKNEESCTGVTTAVPLLSAEKINVPSVERCIVQALQTGGMSAAPWILVSTYLAALKKKGRSDVVLHSTGRAPGKYRTPQSVSDSEPRISHAGVEYDSLSAAAMACLVDPRNSVAWFYLEGLMQDAWEKDQKQLTVMIFRSNGLFNAALVLARAISTSPFPVDVPTWERLYSTMERCGVKSAFINRKFQSDEEIKEVIEMLKTRQPLVNKQTTVEDGVDSAVGNGVVKAATKDQEGTGEASTDEFVITSSLDDPVLVTEGEQQ